MSDSANTQALVFRKSTQGFSLLETMMAMVILSFGILSLAGVLGTGLAFMTMSQADFIAQQKASEAVESIFTARDSSALTWPQILNTTDGGIFTPGAVPLLQPGLDGIVGTVDDVLPIDCIIGPGPDGILGTPDDTCVPLQGYTRTIAITTNVQGDASLRQITVTIDYPAGKWVRQYQLITYISQSF